MNQSLSIVPSAKTVKPPPTSYVHTRVINSPPSKPGKPRLSHSERALSRVETKRHLIALADEIHERTLSEKLRECFSKVAVLSCGRHISKVIPNATCEFRLCPNCAPRRSRKLQKKYVPLLEPFLQKHYVKPVHLVLTQKHRAETLKQSAKRLMTSFQKLVRSDRPNSFWNKHFKGGLWSLEFTVDEKGLYHTHLHILAFRSKFFDVKTLRTLWKEITGDSHILRLDAVSDVLAGAKEVLKYAIKPLSVARLTADNLRDFMKMKNARFIGTFGEFRKHCKNYSTSDNADVSTLSTDLESLARDLVEGCACPVCDDPLFELRMPGNDLPSFLKSLEQSLNSKSPPG
jgi:hypothetical protein